LHQLTDFNTPLQYAGDARTKHSPTASTHLLQLLVASVLAVAPALQAVAVCSCSSRAVQTLQEHQAAPPAAAAAAQLQPQPQQQQQQQAQVVQRVLRCSCQEAQATDSTSCCHTLLLLVVLLAMVLERLDKPRHQLL
jgi:hypothetical protein